MELPRFCRPVLPAAGVRLHGQALGAVRSEPGARDRLRLRADRLREDVHHGRHTGGWERGDVGVHAGCCCVFAHAPAGARLFLCPILAGGIAFRVFFLLLRKSVV